MWLQSTGPAKGIVSLVGLGVGLALVLLMEPAKQKPKPQVVPTVITATTISTATYFAFLCVYINNGTGSDMFAFLVLQLMQQECY